MFPRFHIGESQLPWSMEILETLGVSRAVAGAGFIPKWGATFTTADGACEQYADFTAAPETSQPQTYQVSRAEFDAALLTHAARSGAAVAHGAQVTDVHFERDRVDVSYAHEGCQHGATAAVVVDASGRAGFL